MMGAKNFGKNETAPLIVENGKFILIKFLL